MAAQKPTVYLDTTIPAMLYQRARRAREIGRRLATQEWWTEEGPFFQVFASDVTEDELARGAYPWQPMALAFVRRLPYLPFTQLASACARTIMHARLIPETKPGDAAQLAMATVHRMDYLLTWNYAHLANPNTQRALETLCKRWGWRAPLLISPETIPQVRLWQTIRRKDTNA